MTDREPAVKMIPVEEFVRNGREQALVEKCYGTALQLMAYAQAAKQQGVKLGFRAKTVEGEEVWITSFEVHLDPNSVIGGSND